jgi:hypothetical protein
MWNGHIEIDMRERRCDDRKFVDVIDHQGATGETRYSKRNCLRKPHYHGAESLEHRPRMVLSIRSVE